MPGQCGTIEGTITDVVSGNPVEGIVVHINGVPGQTQSQPLDAKGVYAFDIQVVETSGLQSDSYYARRPYRLRVPAQGFSLRLGTGPDGALLATIDYELADSDQRDATEVSCTIVAPNLSILGTATGLDTSTGVVHDNVALSAVALGAAQPGTYYAVLTAEDGHGTDLPELGINPRYYRERGANKRMLAVVASAECVVASITKGIGHWFDQAFINSAGYVSSSRLQGAGYSIYDTLCAIP